MAAYGDTFESSKSIEERKEFKRKAREEALRKAKEQYEREERRKELKRARGEDTWMLPEVEQRLQQLDQEHSGKSKKKDKKAKKQKKEKKKTKKEKKTLSSGSCEGSEEEWVEAQPQASEKPWKIPSETQPVTAADPAESREVRPVERDEWMTFDILSMKTTSAAERRAEKEKAKEREREKAQAVEQAGLHKLELNPYWKDGGCGLPPEDSAGGSAHKAAVVDDGGLNWLRKSYQRMKEQAERENRSLDEVVADRYGSMEKFQKRLEEAENAAAVHRRGERRPGRGEGGSWRRPGASDRGPERERDGEEGAHPGSNRTHRYRDGDRERGHPEGRSSSRGRARDGHQDGKEDSKHREEHGHKARDNTGVHRDRGWTESPSSSSSFKAKFLKPSDAENDIGCGWDRTRRSPVGFLRPASGEGSEGSGRPAWRKSSSSGQECPGEGPTKPSASESLEACRTPIMGGHQGDVMGSSPSVSDSESDDDEENEEEEMSLTDEEMNKLGAQLIKAELMGNKELVEKLKSRLETARRSREKQPQGAGHARGPGKQASGRQEEDQDVVLYRTDRAGRAWPVNAPSEPAEPRGGRRKKKPIETHRDGERVRYFADDDDGTDLREMVRREKMSSAQDQHALYSRMAAKMMGKQDGDNYTLDDMFVSSAAQRERSGREEARQRDRAVQEHQRLAQRMDKCPHCFDSPELPKHLVVAIGAKVYLCLPSAASLTEGHCLITPLQHHTASTALDEDVWAEIQMFRRALVKMFEEQEKDCVFLETHMSLKRRHHMVYECVPLIRELGDMAPIYFKKAILECDEEWAMNKKVVDLSLKNIRSAVPKGLPYFSVDFGLQGGFAHVIENEQKFPHYFGKEVLGGMLDLEPRRWRKPIRQNFDDQRKKVLQFAQWWKPFDCTKTG